MIILALIVVRLFSLVIAQNLPHLEIFRLQAPILSVHEGDDEAYYVIANGFYHLEPREMTKTIGFALVLVPFIAAFGTDFFDIFFPVVLFNGIFLFSAALALLVGASFLIFRKIAPAVLSGLIFIFSPFVYYIFRNFGPDFVNHTWNDNNFVHTLWMSAMAEPLATFMSILTLFLFLFILRLKKGASPAHYAWLGPLVSFAMMVRMSNITVGAVIFLAIFLYEAADKYKKLFYFSVSALIGFIPQFLFNFYFYGSPLSFGYQREYYTDWIAAGTVRGHAMWGIENLSHMFVRAAEYSWLSVPAFILIALTALGGYFYIRKIDRGLAFIITLWFILPAFFYMFFVTGQTAMRYYMPAIPAFVILSVGALYFLSGRVKLAFLNDKIRAIFGLTKIR